MRRCAHTLKPLLWIIAIALLAVRTSDAHMHLCFDGQEPPQSLHIGDSQLDHHDAGEMDLAHQDVDVDAVDTALAKKVVDANDLVALATVAIVIGILDTDRAAYSFHELPNPVPSLPYLFLPPLRGPPA